MTYHSAAELEQLHLDKMGPELGPLYHRLFNECAWLHVKWAEYVELFGVSEQRVALANAAAAPFFGVVQDTLWNDVLLHLARLTDPERSGGKETLTIQRLPALVDAAIAGDVSARVEEAKLKVAFARDWRNRVIAHSDLTLALKRHPAVPLASASREQVRQALSAVVATLLVVESHYLHSETRYDASPSEGAVALLYRLRDGLEAEGARRKRLKAGDLRPEDWNQPPL